MRRADRRGSEHGVRDPRLSVRDGDLGRRRSLRGRLHPGVPAGSGPCLELLSRADRSASRRRAERGTPGARRARATRVRSGRRHPEHRHAAHSCGKLRCCRGTRIDPLGRVPRLPVGRARGGSPRAARGERRPGLSSVRRDTQARCRAVRRGPSGGRDGARDAAREGGPAHARGRLVARGLARRRSPARSARMCDREPRRRPRSTSRRSSRWTQERARRWPPSSTRFASRALPRSAS